MLTQSARRTAAHFARLFPRHFEEVCVAQQSRTLSPCVSAQFEQSSYLRNDLSRGLTYQIQHPAMCDISKRPGQTLHPAGTKRSLSTIIYPPSEAKVGGPAPDFSAPGADIRMNCMPFRCSSIMSPDQRKLLFNTAGIPLQWWLRFFSCRLLFNGVF